MYKPPVRNYEGVEWQALREVADLPLIEMDDTVSARYYDHWRHGYRMPWGLFDTKGGGIPDKVQFDLLCTLLQDMHTVVLHKINAEMQVIPEEEYRFSSDGRDRVMLARDRMGKTALALGTDISPTMQEYLERTKALTGYNFTNWVVD